MISFQVDDMTCGHCVSSITKAVKAVDGEAKVQIDLATHRVDIEPTGTDAAELSDAIKEAGYTPVAVAAASSPIAAVGAPARKGCCCG
jgi:copper chaperone